MHAWTRVDMSLTRIKRLDPDHLSYRSGSTRITFPTDPDRPGSPSKPNSDSLATVENVLFNTFPL
ncbi:hypothetical protein RUND412_000969 [Rhizina undulata]